MNNFGLLNNIDVHVTVELGSTKMALRDVCALSQDRVIMLDRMVDEPVELLVNGRAVARGEVVAEGNRFGFRIIELIGESSEEQQPRVLDDAAVDALTAPTAKQAKPAAQTNAPVTSTNGSDS